MGETSKSGREYWHEALSTERRRRMSLWLWCQRGVRVEHLRSLVDRDRLVALVHADASEGRRYLLEAGVSEETTERMVADRPESVTELRDRLSGLESSESISAISMGDEQFPERLYDLEEPPAFVFVAGSLAGIQNRRRRRTLAVVGSRKIPADTRDWVGALVGGCAESGMTVVSGGALGADAMAHRAALQAGQPTVSVMPCGVDVPRPKTNSPMFRNIVTAGGALVSEYPPGTGVRSYHYPRRNRLIAALGDATLVLRAGAESGTMLTARAAQAIGRPIGAVPGRPGDVLVEGCHALLAEDGQPVTSVADVKNRLLGDVDEAELDAAETDGPGEVDDAASLQVGRVPWPESLSECADGLLRQLVEELEESEVRLSMDELAKHCSVSAAQMQSAVLEWELAGLVSRAAGGSALDIKLPCAD